MPEVQRSREHAASSWSHRHERRNEAGRRLATSPTSRGRVEGWPSPGLRAARSSSAVPGSSIGTWRPPIRSWSSESSPPGAGPT